MYIRIIQDDYARVRAHAKPSALQIIHVWSLFSKKERVLFVGFFVLAVFSGSFFAVRFVNEKLISVPEVGGKYIEGVLEEPRFINPILATNDTERSLVNLIFQKLFYYDAHGSLQPNAAERYSVSSDGKKYTIILKKDNRWHDGKILTADDVMFTIAMIQNPDYRSPLRPNWQGVTAEKQDEWTIVLTLRQPYAPFAQNLTFGILPKHIWSTIRAENSLQAEFNVKPVGSGPYQFSKFTRSPQGSILSYTVDRRTDAPSNQPPYIETIIFQTFSSEETMLSALQRGKIDGISFVSAKNINKIQPRTHSLYTVRLPQIFALFLNQTKNTLLADKNVREALDRAISRAEIIDRIFHGGASAIGAPLPAGSFGFDETITAPEQDREKAVTLLRSAGWHINPETGMQERKIKAQKNEPEKIEQLHFNLVTSQWPDLVETAQLIKDQLKQIGIDITVEVSSISELEYQYIRPRNYDILLFGEGFGRDPDPFAFWHSSQIKHPGLNLSLYSNKKVDALLESARRAHNQQDIESKYREMQKLIVQDKPALFLYTPNYFFAVKNSVRGITVENLSKPSDRFYEAPGWYIDTDWKLK